VTHTAPTNGAQPRRPNKRKSSSTSTAHEQEAQAPPPFDLNHQRRKDIARFVVDQHGRLPNTTIVARYLQARYLQAAAWHCHGDRRAELEDWFVWVCAPPAIRRNIDAILKSNPPRRVRADTLGKFLHVSDAARDRLRIYTIGSYQTPKAERIKRRKEKDRLAAQARRRANGSKPREQALSRTKPWEAFGIKRRAWERRGKPTPTATTQIRRQYSSLRPSDEFASSSTAPPAARARSARNGNGKRNGKHGPRRRDSGLPKEEHPSHVVHHLTAIGIG
jgi:hypothetical protein